MRVKLSRPAPRWRLTGLILNRAEANVIKTSNLRWLVTRYTDKTGE
jgi:hypothetical protein